MGPHSLIMRFWNIANSPVLGISISDFFAEQKEVQFVFGAQSRVQTSDDDEPIKVELLVPGAQHRDMDPVLVTLDPGEEMDEQPIHEGEEFGFLLSGKIELILDDVIHKLKKDECFYFGSDRKHSVKNTGKVPARILWVVTPPTFYY